VFSGDSWKLAIPAALYTLANSLQYIALSNLQAATFQVSYQLKIFVSSVFGLILLGRSIPLRKWGLLLVLLVGVGLIQIPNARPDEFSLENAAAHFDFPRSLEEWKSAQLEGRSLHKRSATYEGIEEDILTATPRLNGAVGVLATLGACAASGLAGVYFEKVLKDSAKHTSLWVRNVQLAVYSIFPALFIGVVFLDGEAIAIGGIFDGYNWVVWSTIIIQAFGGIATSFCVGPAHADTKNLASATSIIFTSLGSIWLFEFEPTITVSLPFHLVYYGSNQTSFLLAPLRSWWPHISARARVPASVKALVHLLFALNASTRKARVIRPLQCLTHLERSLSSFQQRPFWMQVSQPLGQPHLVSRDPELLEPAVVHTFKEIMI
jgi:UDP-galactose transporter